MGETTSMSPLYFTSFNLGAVLVSLTCLVCTILAKRTDKQQNKLFMLLAIDIGVAAAADALAEIVRAYASSGQAALATVQVAGYIYFVVHTLLAPLFCLYVLAICRESTRRSFVRINLIALPFYITEIIALTNPFTHWMYFYTPDLQFHRNWAVYLTYFVGILYLAVGFIQLIRRWRALTPIKRRGLGYFFFMAGAGIVLQMVVPAVRIELFAETLALFGLMVFVENESDFIDSEAGVYNRYALEMDLAMYDRIGEPYNVVAVRLTNVDTYAHIGGSTLAAQHMTKALADYFKSIVPWYNIYRTAPARFILLDPQMSRDDASDLAERIAQRFSESWEYLDVDISLHAVVVLANVPDDLPKAEDVFYLVDTPVPPNTSSGVLSGDGLSYIMRRAEVERAVQRGLDEGTYEVYFQPIFNKDGKVRSAEALMRLHDSVLGDVPPFEFIEVAERTGLVEEIGEFALREVCAFLASGVPQRFGVAHISVNLSVIQCMKADFAQRAFEIMSPYGIDSSLISFEITESVAAGDYEFLSRVMNQLKRGGHRFAMDDYGTGYSNMHSLVSLDFDVVKIDKSVLWGAEKSDLGKVILENGVSMMRDIGCEVLVEGVETEGQVSILRLLGVDYYQGYYFAKPMPKDEFIAFLGSMESKAR